MTSTARHLTLVPEPAEGALSGLHSTEELRAAFAALTPVPVPDDHRTPVQKAADQARTDAEGFPRGLRTF